MSSISRLDAATFARLEEAARQAQSRAYCIYSHFPVGAALLTDKGLVVTGCNVENASYGLTICAERNAMTSIIAEAAGRPVAAVVVGNSIRPLTPCGMCRQFLAEFNPDMEVTCIGTNGDRTTYTIRELLPAAFDTESLNSAFLDE